MFYLVTAVLINFVWSSRPRVVGQGEVRERGEVRRAIAAVQSQPGRSDGRQLLIAASSHWQSPAASSIHEQPPTNTINHQQLSTATSSHQQSPAATSTHQQPPTSTSSHQQPLATTSSQGQPPASVDSRQQWRESSKVAVVLRGLSFREGTQGSHSIETSAFALSEQFQATQSQLDYLVLPFESAGFSVDVFSATVNCKHTDELVSKFSPRVKADIRLGLWNSSQHSNILAAVSSVAQHAAKTGATYAIVVVLRHDMVLKRNIVGCLERLFQLPRKFLVPFKMIPEWRWTQTKADPGRVPDTIQAMSGNFLPDYLRMMDQHWPAEDIVRDMENIIGKDNLGFISGYEADSDSAKVWNPMYRFAGRKEGPTHAQDEPERLCTVI